MANAKLTDGTQSVAYICVHHLNAIMLFKEKKNWAFKIECFMKIFHTFDGYGEVLFSCGSEVNDTNKYLANFIYKHWKCTREIDMYNCTLYTHMANS